MRTAEWKGLRSEAHAASDSLPYVIVPINYSPLLPVKDVNLAESARSTSSVKLKAYAFVDNGCRVDILL